MTGRLCPMSTASDDSAGAGPRAPVVPQRRHTGRLVAVIITVLAVILVVVGTKVVPDEEIAGETADFDKETFGAENFPDIQAGDRKSTRLNSSHVAISYAVFCL